MSSVVLCLCGPPESAGPRSRGRWPRPSAGGSSASPWPASRTRRRFTGSPDPLPTRHRDASCALRGLGPLLDRIGDKPADRSRRTRQPYVAESFAEDLPCGLRARYARSMDDVLAAALRDGVGGQGPREVERTTSPS